MEQSKMTMKQPENISVDSDLIENLNEWLKYYAEAYNVLHNDIVQRKVHLPQDFIDFKESMDRYCDNFEEILLRETKFKSEMRSLIKKISLRLDSMEKLVKENPVHERKIALKFTIDELDKSVVGKRIKKIDPKRPFFV